MTCDCKQCNVIAAARKAVGILADALGLVVDSQVSGNNTIPPDVGPLDPSLPQVRIERYDSDPERIFGRVFWDGKPQLISYELPWLDNARNVSAIPEGRYICTRHVTARYPESRRAYVLADVPGRSGILFHSGNTARDTDGCILLGLASGKLHVDGKMRDAVLSSRDAMERFHEFINNRRFELEIVSV
jgi:hypothetical protein